MAVRLCCWMGASGMAAERLWSERDGCTTVLLGGSERDCAAGIDR